MNETGSTKLTHLPALDGLRGLAVVGVLLFHGGFAAFEGGFLGVSTFFTLSGFLITSLLLREHEVRGAIDLRAFWSRRFRRLMPAALAGLLVACAYGWWFASPEQLATLRGDVLAGLGYVANWRFVLEQKRYADLFSAPSPVQHFWSLAIEEQFYVVYPLLVFGALRAGGRRLLAGLLALLAVASVVLSFALSGDFDRVYYGTDTRAFELLAGGLFALWWSAPASARAGAARVPRPVRDLFGAAGLLASLAAWNLVEQASPRLAKGGFALQAAATVVVLLAATADGAVARVLSWRPLREIGLVSYGLYVYHWPVFLALDTDRTGLDRVPLFAVRLAVTVALALASARLLELPIRRGRALGAGAVRLAAPGAVLVVVAATLAVTWDPPPSTVAYANKTIDDFAPRVVDVTPPASTTSGGTSAGPSSSTTPGVAAPRTVMMLGDSGMADLQPALGAMLGASGTRRLVYGAGPGFGLTNPDIDWRRIWGDLVAANRPDVVIVMFGGWDIGWMRKNGVAAYTALVREAVTVLTAQGARIEWLAMLPGGATADRPVDPVYAAVAAERPGVVDWYDHEAALRTGVTASGAPEYARILVDASRRLLVRKPDVWHLCPTGAERVAEAVGGRLASIGWAPAVAGGWTAGTWRDDPAYGDPVGGCDVRSTGADR